MLKIWLIWKIEIRSKELVDGHETVLYKPGALFLWGEGGKGGGGGQLSGGVSNPFSNPFESLQLPFILLQISLLFMRTPAWTWLKLLSDNFALNT